MANYRNNYFMNNQIDYFEINKKSWNAKTDIHIESAFYDVDGFLNGKNSLKEIELNLLGDVKGKSILHLQCHFGQDSISLSRMGAKVTGVDLSDISIERARTFAEKTKTDTTFICCDLYDLPNQLDQEFDIVFTTYGTIGWLPDLDKWAEIVSRFLKPGGEFIFVEFHPAVWMYDDDFQKIGYNYFNIGPIVETYNGTYAEKSADLSQQYVMWNHGIGEVLNSLIKNKLQLQSFNEYNYSPYDCFRHTYEFEPGKFRIKSFEDKFPMVYALKAIKNLS